MSIKKMDNNTKLSRQI
uniref:Uncharacterized protein n=1 Tax=Arundo donax TaxID=35708 RepID=A0A0A9GXY2_ARUDO